MDIRASIERLLDHANAYQLEAILQFLSGYIEPNERDVS